MYWVGSGPEFPSWDLMSELLQWYWMRHTEREDHMDWLEGLGPFLNLRLLFGLTSSPTAGSRLDLLAYVTLGAPGFPVGL